MNFKENFFRQLQNSDHILEYSFLIDSKMDLKSMEDIIKPLNERLNIEKNVIRSNGANLGSIEKWVEECFKITHENCCFTLPQYDFTEKGFINGSFSNLYLPVSSIAFLEKSKKFWYFILRQNAILSAYDKLRRYLAGVNICNQSSDFLNYLVPLGLSSDNANKETNDKKSGINRYGLYYLIQHPTLSSGPVFLNTKSELKVDSNYNTTSKEKSYVRSRNSRLTNDADYLCEILRLIFNVKLIHVDPHSINIRKELLQINNLELFQYLVGHKTEDNKNANLKTIFESHIKGSTFTKANYKRYLLEYKKLIDEIKLPVIDSHYSIKKTYTNCKLELVDKLYCRYLIEKETGIELTDCLYRNINFHEKKSYLTGIIDFLSECFLLPNVFSRHYILQIALYGLYMDFFLTKDIKPDKCNEYHEDELPFFGATMKAHRNPIYTSKNEGSYLDRISDEESEPPHTPFSSRDYSESTAIHMNNMYWEKSYTNMLRKLNKVIFPIYDNFFFNTLWKSLKETSGDNDSTCMVKMFLLLSRYLNNEDTISKLFNIEEVFNSENSSTSHLTKDLFHSAFPNIKSENPISENDIDADLYKKCIEASVYYKSVKPSPDFLSHDYLLSGKNTKKSIQRSLQNSILSL